MPICILMLMQVCLSYFGRRKKAHIPTALDYCKTDADAAAAGEVSDHTWPNSLAELAQHAPAPPKDLLHGIV